MEQQKVLWIVFSVTLFLVVVVVVGFVWFLPSDKETEPGELTAGVEPSERVFDPIVWVRDNEEVPGISEETETGTGEVEGDLLLVYGETETTAEASETAAVSEGGTTTGVKVVETAPASTVTTVMAPSVTMTTSLPAAVQPSGEVQVRPGAAHTIVAETRSTVVKSQTPATEKVTQYWIQAGSFQSQSRAEQTQAKLSEKGWNTRIISRDVAGKIYFRVRLGPFDTEGEAGKFLNWITDIDTFESSYISQVYTTRAIN